MLDLTGNHLALSTLVAVVAEQTQQLLAVLVAMAVEALVAAQPRAQHLARLFEVVAVVVVEPLVLALPQMVETAALEL